jgi:hypothetical protein
LFVPPSAKQIQQRDDGAEQRGRPVLHGVDVHAVAELITEIIKAAVHARTGRLRFRRPGTSFNGIGSSGG